MENFRDIRVKYNHPAIPPVGIKIDTVYTVGHLIDNYKIDESIKTLFKPVDFRWEDLEKKPKRVSKKEVEEISDGVEV